MGRAANHCRDFTEEHLRLDVFLDDMAIGRGAGDVNTLGVNSNCSGVDCSGHVSRIWECGRFATASFHKASFEIDWEDLRMGDALNKAGSHIRLFVRWEDTDTVRVYEAMGGAGHPWRVVRRTLDLSSFGSHIPIRYDRDDDSTSFVRIDPEPTIQWIVRSGSQAAWIPLDGVLHFVEGGTNGIVAVQEAATTAVTGWRSHR